MGRKDPRIDAYIAKSQPFARPILKHLRAVVHAGCPDVVETIKWGMPNFEHHGIMAGMAAFKAHASFGFWKGALIVDPKHNKSVQAMGSFGRIASLKNLPPRATLVGYVKRAAALNEVGVTVKRPVKAPKKPLPVPADLKAALAKSAKAKAGWERLSPSHRREYIEWITSAKQAETRTRRLTKAIAQVAQGKSQNWKYESR